MAKELAVIQLQIDGAQAARETLEKLDSLIHSAEGRHKIELSLEEAKREVIALDARMKQLQNTRDLWAKGTKGYRNSNTQLKATTAQYRMASVRVKELSNVQQKAAKIARQEAKAERDAARAKEQAAKAADKLAKSEAKAAAEAEKLAQKEAKLRSFGNIFNGMSSKIAHAGSAMQSLGNALTRLTNPFSQFTSGIAMGAGYRVLGKFTEGLENSFNRADVMRKFPRVMEAMGYGADEAEASIRRLDDAVQGLPTSLDDMVGMAQRFVSTTGDLTRGTDLAIAANNAFLASMSTETQKYQGMMQLQDVIGGKDMNAKEWQALANSMMPAIRMMGESLGLEGKALDEYVAKVQQGKIANQEFLDTLVKAGTDENGKIRTIAMESLDTWEAFFSRVGTAASRLGYKGIIEPLNELVNTVTSGKFKSVNLLLDDFVVNGIDKMQLGVKEWIKAHPEEITNFFKTLSNIKWSSIAKGWAESMMTLATLLEKVGNLFEGKDLSWIGKFMVYGNLLGKAFTIVGGLLKGSRHPLAFIGTLVVKAIKALGGGSLFDKVKGIFGKKKVIEEAGEAAKSVPTVADTFKRAFGALEGLIKASGAVALVAGTGVVAFESAKRILQDLKEMTDMLSEGDWSKAPLVATGVIAGIGAFVEIFNYIGTVLGSKGLLAVAIASAASFLVTGTFAADMWAIKKGVEQIRDTIKTLDEVATSIQTMNGIGTLGEDVKQKFRNTIDAINEIKNMFVGKNGGKMDRGQVEAGLPTFSIGKVTALTNIGNAVKQLQNIASQLNSLSAISVSDPSQTIADIKTACQSLQGIRVSKGLAKQAEHIADSILQVRRIAYHINKLAGLSVNAGGFADTIAQIKSALESIKGMSQTVTLDIKVVMGSGFRSSVQGVVKQLKNAKKDIEKYKKPIAFIVPVNVTFSVVTNASAAIAKMKAERQRVNNARNNRMTRMYESAGGYNTRQGVLYRSGGGGTSRSFASVASYRPRGTDKIPAMLTEGEYVQKKQAVDFFGVDFMRKVNNLDVRGAMNALLTKAGTSVGVGRQSIVNNTVNNNQRITQNINTNNPNFAGARMGRFVGAL